MQQRGFATYLHPETIATSKPANSIPFVGFSWPYFSQVRQSLALRLAAYPSLPLRVADLDRFGTVHTSAYLQQLQLMAADTPPANLPHLSRECSGLEYCLPGYRAGLGGMLEAIDRMRAGTLDRAYCFSLGGHHAQHIARAPDLRRPRIATARARHRLPAQPATGVDG